MSQRTVRPRKLRFTNSLSFDSYVSNLTPSFVRALAVSAWGHQITPLRDAICRHIAMETSIRVQPSVCVSCRFLNVHTERFSHMKQRHGWPTFCLEFHLAYLVLREVDPSPTEKAGAAEKDTKNTPLVDLAWLDIQSSSGSVTTGHVIEEANVSVVVCGWSNTQWTGYAFANTRVEAEEEEEEDTDSEEETEDMPQQDFLAAEDGLDYMLDANNPEWDARKYWLRVLSARCQLVWKEWQYLVRTVEDAIEAWVSPALRLKTARLIVLPEIERSLP